MDDEKVFSSADMYISALLLANDYALINVDKSDPKHVRFKFSSDEDQEPIDNIVQAYTNGTAEVNASRFVESERKIKSLLHNG
jgi:hypothetical protein